MDGTAGYRGPCDLLHRPAHAVVVVDGHPGARSRAVEHEGGPDVVVGRRLGVDARGGAGKDGCQDGGRMEHAPAAFRPRKAECLAVWASLFH